MGLDARGITSVVELVVYTPLFPLSAYLLFKHGLRREGWLYLLLLSIIRILGAITHIASETSSSPNATLRIIYSIMESSGLSPLLSATLGFLGTIGQHAFDGEPLISRGLKLMNILCHVALALNIAGGVKVGTNTTNPDAVDSINSGINLRHIGAILFLVEWLATCAMVAYFILKRHAILKHRQTMLKAIAISLPFLGVRVLYTILSAFAPTGIPFPGVDAGSSGLSSFNSTTGSFPAYLVMSVIMEIIVLVIYVVVGLVTPLQNDYAEGGASKEGEENMLHPTAYAPNFGNDRSVSSISVTQKTVTDP